MLFQFNSDNQVHGDTEVETRIQSLVEARLRNVQHRLTRVEVHVGEINGPRGGVDKRCAVELRPNGLDPVTATDTADTIEQAAAGATDKAVAAFQRVIGRTTTRKGH
nr:HPF/RaiA family ribosome-associated protein [uncultured Sphingomonas sp.]